MKGNFREAEDTRLMTNLEFWRAEYSRFKNLDFEGKEIKSESLGE